MNADTSGTDPAGTTSKAGLPFEDVEVHVGLAGLLALVGIYSPERLIEAAFELGKIEARRDLDAANG